MALKRFIIDAPREPTIHDVVDRIMANIEAEGAYKVPNVVDAPVAAPAAPAYPSYDDEMRVPIAPWQEAAMQEIGWAMDAARPMRGAAAQNAAPNNPPQPYGEAAGFPTAGAHTQAPWPTGNRRPFFGEGNWFGESLSGG